MDQTQTDRQHMARLWRDYIWPQKTRLFLALIFMAILAASTAGYIWVIGLIIDAASTTGQAAGQVAGQVAEQAAGEATGQAAGEATGQAAGDPAMQITKNYAKTVLPALLGLTLLSGVSGYVQRILSNHIALNTVEKMQGQMLAAAHGRDYVDFTREPVGNLIAKFTSDVSVISAALVRVLGNLLKDVLTVVFSLIVMIKLNWQLSLVMGIFALALLPIISISKRMRGNARDVQAHIGQITAELKESLGSAHLVKTYGLEAHEQARLNLSFAERVRLYLRLITQQARVDPVMELVGGLVIAGVVIFGVYQHARGAATGGEIAGVLGGLLILAPRLRALGTLNNVIQEGLSSLTRIFEVIDARPKITDAANAPALSVTKGHIELCGVNFSYDDDTQALANIQITAKAGHITALVGPSGGGKSTIMALIPRLYDVGSGAVLIDGQDVRQVQLASLRRQMAIVSQDPVLFNDTIAHNIGFGDLEASEAAIIEAAKAADAHDFITALPQGYDTKLGEGGDGLSGGQKQRISIARAILRDAPILLLDEATSALDTESEAKVQAALARLSENRTTLVIAHRLGTVRNADQIYVLDGGAVVESGTDATLRKKGGVYANLKNMA